MKKTLDTFYFITPTAKLNKCLHMESYVRFGTPVFLRIYFFMTDIVFNM